MKNRIPLLALFFIFSGLLLLSCDRDLGSEPVGTKKTGSPAAGSDTSIVTIAILTSPAILAASNSDQAAVTAVISDRERNPLEGVEVRFSASGGYISSEDSTDNLGRASALFQSVQENLTVVITVTAEVEGVTYTDSAEISIIGMRLDVTTNTGDALTGSTVPVTIFLTDAYDNPVSNTAVMLTGADEAAGFTDGAGKLTTTLTGAAQGRVFVSASALGARDSASVDFWDSSLPGGQQLIIDQVGDIRIIPDPANIKASNSDQSLIRVIAYNSSNNPVEGAIVRFSATHGIIGKKDTTDTEGIATAILRSVPLNVDARVMAEVTLDDSTYAVSSTVTFSGLEVTILPAVSDALLDQVVPVTIMVTDGAGAPVPDAALALSGMAADAGATNGAGLFRTSANSSGGNRAVLTASTLGSQDTTAVNFWTILPEDFNATQTIRIMRIFSSRSQLSADNTDFAVITVILTNEANNPSTGESIKFTSDLGIITGIAVVDSAGRAEAVLRSAPVNGICNVRAEAVGRNISASTQVIFSGVTLKLIPDRTELKINERVSIEAFLKDGSGSPIGGDDILFDLSGSGAYFDNGNTSLIAALDPNGRVSIQVTAASEGNVTIRASGLNTSDQVTVHYSNNSLTLSAASGTIQVGGNDSTLITAEYRDGSNAPIAGRAINFAVNAGSINPPFAITDGSGIATAWLRSADFAGTATIQGTADLGIGQTEVVFSAAAAAHISLAISPDNISINGGISELTATVTDANGNMVSDADVNFRILKGPGGGEAILKPVVTSQFGTAVSELEAGSLPSLYRGTEVEASVGGIADTSKLTISGAPYIITVSRPEDDTLVVADAGFRDESTFEFFVGAVVQDINGNPVADGTEVHFSAVVTGLLVGGRKFYKWKGLDSPEDIEPLYAPDNWDVPFEDINNNLRFDPGLDLALDWMYLDAPVTQYYNTGVSSRGEDVDGNGIFDWNPVQYDVWYDFNRNGVCDLDVGENDTVDVGMKVVFADLNNDGVRNRSELIRNNYDPVDSIVTCDAAPSGDYPYATWDVRGWLPVMTFTENDFAVTIDVSAVTAKGVAKTRLIYPRQFSRRLIVTVNAESQGIRDKDGERFPLPQILESK